MKLSCLLIGVIDANSSSWFAWQGTFWETFVIRSREVRTADPYFGPVCPVKQIFGPDFLVKSVVLNFGPNFLVRSGKSVVLIEYQSLKIVKYNGPDQVIRYWLPHHGRGQDIWSRKSVPISTVDDFKVHSKSISNRTVNIFLVIKHT